MLVNHCVIYGRRVKNKVASLVIGKSVAYKHSLPPHSPLHDEEVSSDEFDYEEEEDPRPVKMRVLVLLHLKTPVRVLNAKSFLFFCNVHF